MFQILHFDPHSLQNFQIDPNKIPKSCKLSPIFFVKLQIYPYFFWNLKLTPNFNFQILPKKKLKFIKVVQKWRQWNFLFLHPNKNI